MPPNFRRSQIAAFRLARHHLIDREQADLAAVCRDVCGIQAQLMAAAEMQLWARRPGLTRADIHSALYESRTLVKTSCMRHTLHLIPASDFSIYVQALKKSRIREMLRIMSRYGGVKQKEADDVTKAVVEVLAAGPMTRRELTERVLSLKIVGKKARPWFEKSWWGVVRQAIVEGLICYGPDRNREVAVVRVDQWLPEKKEVSEPEAQLILLRRYLSAYGPAAPRDFSKWTGIAAKEVQPVWESLKDELVDVPTEDGKGWILRADYDWLATSRFEGQVLRLLPYFDPYMLGHAGKNHLVDERHYKRVYRKAAWISPVVLLNGRVIGTWSYTRQGKGLTLAIKPFQKFTKVVRNRIEAEAARLGCFLETPWEMKFSPP